MVTKYKVYKVGLTESQIVKIISAMKHNCEITLRLTLNQIKNKHNPLNLSERQISHLQKAIKNNTGAEIRISKSQIRKVQTEQANFDILKF